MALHYVFDLQKYKTFLMKQIFWQQIKVFPCFFMIIHIITPNRFEYYVRILIPDKQHAVEVANAHTSLPSLNMEDDEAHRL